MASQEPQLAPHVREAVQAIADMQLAHHRGASRMERFMDYATATVGRPTTLIAIAAFTGVWVLAAVYGHRIGIDLEDAYPFPLLDLILSLAAIVIAVLILGSQRRADRLGLLREQMTLELALLTEHKASKLIQLLEELRRDLPDVKDRHDQEADAMADKPDHATVLTAIDAATNNPTPDVHEIR